MACNTCMCGRPAPAATFGVPYVARSSPARSSALLHPPPPQPHSHPLTSLRQSCEQLQAQPTHCLLAAAAAAAARKRATSEAALK